jgi:hypothetical protein
VMRPDAGNRSTRARHHEGCANSATARKHQHNRKCLHATGSGQCGGGVELTDEGSFVEKAGGFRKRKASEAMLPSSKNRGCKCLKSFWGEWLLRQDSNLQPSG